MNVITSDFETTTSNSGNPFDVTNVAVCIAHKINNERSYCSFIIDNPDELVHTDLDATYVFFNAKFDLHWYRRLGQPPPKKIWCCQLAEYYLSGFTHTYPSLDEAAEKYGLGKKIDAIKLLYWDKGVNTDKIPRADLTEYACQDVELTYKVYLAQLEQFQKNPKLFTSYKIALEDLLVLEEMEWNGITYDPALCEQRAVELEKELHYINNELVSFYPTIPINFNSGPQLSAFLYGGTIKEELKEHIGFYKTGAKAGQPKYKTVIKEHQLPQLVKPLPKTEMAAKGVYSTSEDTLRKLKGGVARKVVPLLLKYAEKEKLLSTYYKGIPALCEKMNWQSNTIHGQFNQVVTKTSRLSSSKPNLQNFAGDCQDIFVTRMDKNESTTS